MGRLRLIARSARLRAQLVSAAGAAATSAGVGMWFGPGPALVVAGVQATAAGLLLVDVDRGGER